MTDIVGKTLDYVISNRYHHDRKAPGEYPSSASSTVNKKGVGNCGRMLFYRHHNPIPFSVKALHAMNRGVEGEKTIQKMLSEAGLLLACNTKFSSFPLGGASYDNDFYLSGEVDVIIASPDEGGVAYILELKSYTHSDFTAAALGMKPLSYIPIKGFLFNTKYLCQSIIYESEVSPNVKIPGYEVKGTILCYYDASNFSNRIEFLIQLDEKGRLIVDGVPHSEWKAKSIFKKMNKIRKYILKGELPPRDYTPVYTEAEARSLHASGDIFKKTLTAVLAGESVGCFDCNFCSYRAECIADAMPDGTKSTNVIVELGDL